MIPTNAAHGTTRFISSRKISLRVSKPKIDCAMAAIFFAAHPMRQSD